MRASIVWAMSCLVASAAFAQAAPRGPAPAIVPAGGLSLMVEAGQWMVRGRAVRVADAVLLRLDRPAVVQVRGEIYQLSDERPKGYAKGTKLLQLKSRSTTLPGCLVPGSVVVRASDGTVLAKDKDYLVDETWGMLGRLPQGRIGPDQRVELDYAYSLQRLDTIQLSPNGNVALRKGSEAKTCPVPPGAAEGWLALANVLVNYNAAQLTREDVFPIGPPLPPPTAAELRQKAAQVARARERLLRGGPLKIVFWGDSVTAGGDASRPECRFPDAFVLALRAQYPQAAIEFHNAGIGGSSTTTRLAGLKTDVLDQRPDLVVIEFVNDMGLAREIVHRRYGEIIDTVRAAGAEVILVTPHFTMPSMMRFANYWGEDQRPACHALREVAQARQVGLADAARVWQHLAKTGLPYITLLYNGINHPDDRGHRIFVDELLKFF